MSLLEIGKSILPAGPKLDGIGRERRSEPRYPSSAPARLTWREGNTGREVSAWVVDISGGGAALRTLDAPPVATAVGVHLECGGRTESLEAEVLGVGPGPEGERLVRLRFLERCSPAILEASAFGRRPRRAPGHDPFAGMESLESRDLLSTVPVGPDLTVATQVYGPRTVRTGQRPRLSDSGAGPPSGGSGRPGTPRGPRP